MLKYRFNERVGLKTAAYFFEIRFRLFAVAIYAEARLAVEVELLARIVIHHLVKTHNSALPVFYSPAHLLNRHVFDLATPYLL